jgi:hypothetical protein
MATNFKYVTVGSYVVETNYWNQAACPTTQCMSINNITGDFAVTAGDFECGDTVATYPAVYYGCNFGSCSPGTNLPIQVGNLHCVTSSWSFVPTNTGLWDAAYDIWFSTTTNTGSYNGGAELMIWLDYMPGTGAGGQPVTTGISIDGYNWDLWEGPVGWNYIAYLANPPITSFNDADILAFINDSVSRGYINTSWYLAAIEAGNELRTGGVPFTSSGFTASVNNSLCGTPTFTSTPTSTPTATPCGYPGNTCTPTDTPTATDTPTPTATPSTLFTVFPNPWPDPKNPGDNSNFYYFNDKNMDQVQLKIYTVSFRKVYEDDTLPTGPGPQSKTFNLAYLNASNGLYYYVLVWKNGNRQSQKVMKVLIQR